MTAVLQAIARHAQELPQAIALQGENAHLSYAALQQAINGCAEQLSTHIATYHTQCMALALDNSPAWIVLDLAAMQLAMPLVPVPAFFTPAQKQHALGDAGVNLLCTDQAAAWLGMYPQAAVVATLTVAHLALSVVYIPATQSAPLRTPHRPSVAKITYTSGTTGQPKGVCLSSQAMDQVALAISEATLQSTKDRHFCVLPLATLLENVAGVYASLLAGATVIVWSCAKVGFLGSRFEIGQLIAGLSQTAASTAILIPELCQALVHTLNAQAPQAMSLPHLRFLAVGGARVNPALLVQAQQLGLPLFEGYGLSESASVVALNTPSQHRIGSIGRALPHMQLRQDHSGEIWIKGANYLGYTQADGMVPPVTDADGFIATGDLGYQDAEGFWYLYGRKKNVFITSFGRNVSPEWVESELNHHPLIAQACVFGEAQPINTAVLVLRRRASQDEITAAIAVVNQALPDYAQVGQWLLAEAPFSPQNGQLTANGRLKRDAIWQSYQSTIAALGLAKVAI